MDNLTKSIVLAGLVSFVASFVLAPIVIPILRKIKAGQNVRTDGPKEHLKKSGTPTMGGIIIIMSFFIGVVFHMKGNIEGIVVVFVTIAYGVIGFLDDYIKVVKKRSLGLKAYQKLGLQIIVTGILAYYLTSNPLYSYIYIPFTDGKTIDLPNILYIPFIFIVTLGTVNGTNFTDGLDGLAAGITALVTMFFVFIALTFGNLTAPIAAAAFGSLAGFLLFNTHPAKIFMGDTGSLALGGFISTLALILKMPLFIPIVGLIYLVEAISVILQVVYFKLTNGKRLFRMAPIHHHFELKGWRETKVVAVFYIITGLMCLVGYIASRGILSN